MAEKFGDHQRSLSRTKSKQAGAQPEATYSIGSDEDIKPVEVKDDNSPTDENATAPGWGGYYQFMATRDAAAADAFYVNQRMGFIRENNNIEEPQYEPVDCGQELENLADSHRMETLKENLSKEAPATFKDSRPISMGSADTSPINSLSSEETEEEKRHYTKLGSLTEFDEVKQFSKQVLDKVFAQQPDLPEGWNQSGIDRKIAQHALQAYNTAFRKFGISIGPELQEMFRRTKEQFNFSVDQSLAESVFVFFEETKKLKHYRKKLGYFKFYREHLEHRVRTYRLEVEQMFRA